MVKIVGIIPARMESSRFPGKPLAKLHGIPMIGHVYFRSKMSSTLDDVYVATCNKEIEEYISSIKGKVVMTSPTHKRASDRIAEALLTIEKQTGELFDIIVMIQGDEPMVVPEMIDEAVHPFLETNNTLVTNLMAPIKTEEEHNDPNEVKVVVDKENYALYFSREPIPSNKKESNQNHIFKQVCIIPFTRTFLLRFNTLDPTPLEIIESVDMLRIIEHGYKVKMVPTQYQSYSVDTVDDLKHVEHLLANDKLMQQYL
jgi:3-deoxy-manno-octulosonate cytidylyltransferase (CMP-KDO synthetase)